MNMNDEYMNDYEEIEDYSAEIEADTSEDSTEEIEEYLPQFEDEPKNAVALAQFRLTKEHFIKNMNMSEDEAFQRAYFKHKHELMQDKQILDTRVLKEIESLKREYSLSKTNEIELAGIMLSENVGSKEALSIYEKEFNSRTVKRNKSLSLEDAETLQFLQRTQPQANWTAEKLKRNINSLRR